MLKSGLLILSGNAFASLLLLARNLLVARLIPVAGSEAGTTLVRCHLREQGPDGARAGVGQRPEETQIALLGVPVIARLEDLKVHFPIRKGLFKRAVAQVRAVLGA